MNKKELENMAEQAAVVWAWCVYRLPVNERVSRIVQLVDLIGAQNDTTDDFENALIALHYRLEGRLARGQW